MQAITFAVQACGYVPRCAVESENQQHGRLEKIIQLIKACPLGIHDLSSNGPDSIHGMARFNMPLELGLFLGAAVFGRGKKSLLIMDAKPFEYHKFISDLKGRDLQTHGNDHRKVIAHVRNWLNREQVQGSRGLPGGIAISRRYEQFKKTLPALLGHAELDESEVSKPEHFVDWSRLVTTWLAASG